jgi:hypothetical protein
MLDLPGSMSAASKPVISQATARPKTLEGQLSSPTPGKPPDALTLLLEEMRGESSTGRHYADRLEETLSEGRAIAKAALLREHENATKERICEVVQSIALELGDERLIERVAENLAMRGLVATKQQNRKRKPRRYTTFLDLETGTVLNAKAKAEGKNRYFLIRDLVRAQLGLPPLER